MKKILRYFMIGVVAAIAFLVAVVAIFVAVFDANAYKSDLSDLVREQTGRELVFYGDVELTIYPALGMKLGAMSFSNREGFGAKPMVKVGEASISVDMASLIRFAPEVDKLVLRDLEVNLLTDKAGETNWGDLIQAQPAAKKKDKKKSADKTAADKKSEQVAGSGTDFEIRGAFGGLDLQNIRLLWRDDQAGTRFRVTDLDISTGRIVPNQPFPLQLNLEARGDVRVSVDFRTDVEYLIDEQRLTLDGIVLALNEYKVKGNLRLSDFAQPTPALRFDLATKNIDVDALLGTPPAKKAGAGPEKPKDKKDKDEKKDKKDKKDKDDKKDKKEKGDKKDKKDKKEKGDKKDAKEKKGKSKKAADKDIRIALPRKILRDLDIDGILSIGKLKAQNLRMRDIQIAVKAQEGVVGFKPVTLDMYDGKVETSAVVDVRSRDTKFRVDNTLKSVQVGKLLKDFMGDDLVSGKLTADVKLNTDGEWLSELKENLNGRLELTFLDGALKGFNIRHSIDTAKAKISFQDPPKPKTLKTDFSSLKLSGVIRDGVFRSKDLDLQAPLLRVGGEGTADINREEVDYIVNAKIVGSVEGQKGDAASELAGLDIPVHIKGPFVAPKIDVLIDELLKGEADAEKKRLEAIEAQKQDLKKQIKKEQDALAKSKEREKKKKLEVEEARQKQKLEKKKKKEEKKLKKKAEKEKKKLEEELLKNIGN